MTRLFAAALALLGPLSAAAQTRSAASAGASAGRAARPAAPTETLGLRAPGLGGGAPPILGPTRGAPALAPSAAPGAAAARASGPAPEAAPAEPAELERELTEAARRFAAGAGAPHSLPRERLKALAEVRDLARRLKAERGVELWDGGVFLRPDGSAAVLFAPADERLSEADARARFAGPVVLLPFTESANAIDRRPDQLFGQEGGAIFRLRHGTRGEFIRRSKALLREYDRLVTVEGGRVAVPGRFRRFLATLAAEAFPGEDAEALVERAVRSNAWHDASRDRLRADGELARLLAQDARFPRWTAALKDAFLQAQGYSGLVAAEKLLLAAAARRLGLDAPSSAPALAGVLDEVLAVVELAPAFAPLVGPLPALVETLTHDDALDEADAVAAGVSRDMAASRGRFYRGMARLLELLRVLPPKAGPGSEADRLDFVERFYRQTGVENAGRGRDYRYTNQRVFSGTTYYPYEQPLPPIADAKPRGGDLRGALRRMLSGNSRYEDFEAKFADERPLVRDFLLSSPDAFPELSDRLRKHVNREHAFGVASRGTYPIMINRFWPDYARWEAMAWDRVTFDFVRGVEHQLLRRVSLRRFAVRLVSDWAPEDFSAVTDADLDWAVAETLRIGRHRAKKLDNVPYRWTEYRLKQLKDPVKRLLLMNVPKTKYLRHRFTWDSYFGIGWDCMCWGRESLFRVAFKK